MGSENDGRSSLRGWCRPGKVVSTWPVVSASSPQAAQGLTGEQLGDQAVDVAHEAAPAVIDAAGTGEAIAAPHLPQNRLPGGWLCPAGQTTVPAIGAAVFSVPSIRRSDSGICPGPNPASWATAAVSSACWSFAPCTAHRSAAFFSSKV